jgi:uncharacterized protein
VTDDGRSPGVGPVTHNVEKILDAHTHLSGSGSGESAENILECLDACGVEKVFLFAPLIDLSSMQLTDENLDDIRAHNDYCADICSSAPERLLGFCCLNPSPDIAGGDHERAVDLMIEEAERCYRELGLRGVGELVPSHWYPNDPPLLPLYEKVAELGMYVVFHSGIFFDGRQSTYCRPTFFEAVHQVRGFRGHLAHVGWPWHDECIAVLNVETTVMGQDPANWDLKTDLSFGSPADWQLDVWQRAIDTLPPAMLCYGSDVFWPASPENYREQYLQPQLGLFETATTRGHIVQEGSIEREWLRSMIFFENAYSHWQAAVREPQQPQAAERAIETPRASQRHSHG